MTHACPTVKIVASDPAQGDFVVINEADFDAKQHTPFVEKAPAQKKGKDAEAAAAD